MTIPHAQKTPQVYAPASSQPQRLRMPSVPTSLPHSVHLIDCLRRDAALYGGSTAFSFRDSDGNETSLSWEELDCRARTLASSLQACGAAGERALLLLPPGLDYVAALFGCLYAGVIAVPSYPPRKRDALAGIAAVFADSEAAFALTTDTIAEDLNAAAPHLAGLGGRHFLVFDDLCRGCPDDWQEPAVRGDSIALLQYTSGSTTAPRGVILTHANLMCNLRMIQEGMLSYAGGKHVFWLPPFHDMGLMGGILESVFCGASTTLMAPMTFLQRPFKWLQTISDIGADGSGAPGFGYDLCVRRITPEQRRALDLSCWRIAFVGAEPIRREIMDRFVEAFEPCGFKREALYPCYGLAEATLYVTGGWWQPAGQVHALRKPDLENNVVVSAPAQERDAIEVVGCGRPPHDLHVTIVNPETHRPSGDEEVGEVWVSGPSVAQGYWGKPDATEETFRARVATNGQAAFLRTGDLGFIKDGQLFITGRLKDLIIVHGRNHYPQDLEWTAQECCAVVKPVCCAAFTVSDTSGDELVLVAELDRRTARDASRGASRGDDDPAKTSFEAIVSALRRAVAEGHDLEVHRIVLVKEGSIPRTSSGKIRRRACRKQLLDGTLEVMYEG